AVIAVLLAAIPLQNSYASGGADLVHLKILAINDFHGYITSTEKLGGRPVGGAAYLSSYFVQREMQANVTLRVHAGDAVGASPPLSGLLQDEPTIEVLSMLGFDVGVPGNHEFDEGLAELYRLQYGGHHDVTGYFHGSSFPLVAANVIRKDTGEPIFPPFVIKAVLGVPVAFIGVVTAEAPSVITQARVSDLEFGDPVEAVNRWVREIRSLGIEAIVVLAHEGGTVDEDSGLVEGPIVDIAFGVDDAVDAIVSGHTHQGYAAHIDDKLVVQAYSKGTAFADIHLVIDRNTGDVAYSEAEIVTVWADAVEPDSRILGLIDKYEEEVKPVTERVIATAATDLTRKQSEAGESALGNLIADAHRWVAEADIAFTNPGGIRNDLQAGDVTRGELYVVQPFGNDLVKMTMTGDQIQRALNQQWRQVGDSVEVKFLQLSGIRYTWDPSLPLGNRIVSATLDDGTPIQSDAEYTVAVNSFLASGGDGFTVFAEACQRTVVTNDLDALIQFLQSLGRPVEAEIEGRITKLSPDR
ncbi:MAG: bifunctional metallophosphatase/5'-nucleotidase, partial [Firmicutes bacterium]|nr:bifunctional metallophosphatase/5'-nucleotidase [Bacillota bacterium]